MGYKDITPKYGGGFVNGACFEKKNPIDILNLY